MDCSMDGLMSTNEVVHENCGHSQMKLMSRGHDG